MKAETTRKYAALLGKARAHPTRLQNCAVELLKGTKCVTDIQDILPASRQTFPSILRCFAMPGWSATCPDGAQRCYYVSRPRFASAVIAFLMRVSSAIR